MNTKRTLDALPPDERRLLESIVTLISAHIKRANGVRIVTQKELPNMPRPVEPDYRPHTDYVLEQLDVSGDGYRIATNDGHVIGLFSPVGEGTTREVNTMLLHAIIETFNAVQNDGR